MFESNNLEWTHYISKITDTNVWITDETTYSAYDLKAMQEKYGSEVLIQGRMCIRVGDEWAWRMTHITDEDIAQRDKWVADFIKKFPNQGRKARTSED